MKNKSIPISEIIQKNKNQNLNWYNYYVHLILKEFLVREMVQIGVLNCIQQRKSFMIPSVAKELTIYPRDIIKT